MNYRHLSLRCRCGEIPETIAEVGFTDDHQLVVHWWCSQCHRVVYAAKPLTECWRECPSSETSLDRILPQWSPDCYQKEDAEFLRSIGVQA
jgi:hypothetical protein